MRKTIIFLLVWVLCSCVNNRSKEPMIADENGITIAYEMEFKNVTMEKLTFEKLRNYFELLELKNNHPEFSEGILEQLKDFSDEEFLKMGNSDDFIIENIRKVGEDMTLSDSIQKMILYYDIQIKNQIETDSIAAWITTKTILLDGVPTKSTKITFSSVE